MQAVPGKYQNPIVAGAYYSSIQENVSPIILLMEEQADNIFVMRSEDGEPLMEFVYDNTQQTITCTGIFSREKLNSYLCNGAMAALGWEIAVIMSVPSGGSSLAFGVLWSVVTVSYCG